MANLRYSDKHNMVAFLKKPTESVGFTEIVDFLKGTSLRYALSHNPTIYDSLVKQFWQTATVRTLANGIQELVASVDNKEYTITKASIRSQLQLADATGIINLSDAKIYEGLATLGYVSEGKLTFWKKHFTPQWKFLIHTILHCISPKSGGWDQFGSTIATALICLSSNRVYNFSKLIFDGMVHNLESNTKFLMYPRFLQIILDITTNHDGKYIAPTLTKKIFGNMKRGYAGEHVPLLPAMLAGAAEDQGEGSAIPAEPHHTPIDPIPSTSQPSIPFTTEPPHSSPPSVRVETEGVATTTFGLDAGIDNGNIHESPLRSHKAPLPEGNTSRSVEDCLKLKELMAIVPKMKVKSLEVALKRMSKRVILSDSEDEETENQGRKIQDIDNDPLVSLVRESMKDKEADFVVSQSVSTYKRRAMSANKGKEIGTGLDFFSAAKERLNSAEVEVNTEVNPSSAGVNTVKGQREGKAPMPTEDVQATKRTKAQIEQEKAGLAKAMRLQALQDEEATRQVHLDTLLAKRIQEEQELSEQQQKRKDEVQKAAQYYTEEDWDTIRAKLEANAELTKSLQGENVSSDDFAKRMVDMINQKKKYYAEQKAKAERDKPMTQAQQRDYMSTFIKNQSSWKMAQLKKLTFEELKVEFEKLMRSIESFVPMGSEERVKRPGVQLEQESSKKQKTVGIEEVPVIEESTAEPVTAQYETEEEREAHMKDKVTDPSSDSDIRIDIIRRDGSDKIYMSFGAILKDFSRDDLTELYRLVIKKYEANRPEEMYDIVLWGDLKTMFDPPLSDDAIWSWPLQQKIVNWRYYDSCAIHCLTLDASTIYMLADRKYPLSKDACQVMLNMKLKGGTNDEVCYQLLKMIKKQARIRWSGI
ncbi:hypothetical protein Tco_1327641 [Tanacetum coccineum]